ncbi:MAG: RHS repeat-associated core domain-containing protein, partial [Clostridia bacterium]|nr:RHS repeat-associated core domain-containing protein [Clostridia bacterium]
MYSEGNLVSAKEYSITLSDEEFVTGKTLLNKTYLFYDNEGNLTKKAVTFEDGTEQITSFEHPEEGNQVARFEVEDLTVSSLSKTDHLGRKIFDEIQTSVANVSRQFEYVKGNATRDHILNEKVKSLPTTQLVSKITFADGRTIEYEYDKEERITKIIDSLDGETDYTYDALGQLLSEYRKKKGEHISKPVNIMTYDNYGNIKTKNGVRYVYDDVWKDKIISAGGKSIVYDEQGNPTNYFGNTLTWEKGRQLKSFNLLSFKYNANGIRTSKIVNGIEHKYILEGTKILKETWEDNTLIPLYDNEDSVCGIKYNGTAYFFIKNLQNDVIAIVDKNGETVARYSYDAWGMPTELYSDESDIGYINPFRYRSYYYDSEISLYYLQSRYYDPRGGRFLNADMPEFGMVEQGALAHNLFAYCGNEPVGKVDSNGHTPIQAVFAAIGGIAGWYFGDYIAKKMGYKSGWKYWAIRTGVIVGGAVLGWFAGTSLLKLVKAYLTWQPTLLLRVINKLGTAIIGTKIIY